MALKLSNNATSRLAASLSNVDTTVVLAAGDGDKFPTLATGDWFPITIVRSDTQREIVYATARTSDVLTVSRGQEGTAALSFAPNDRIELRATAGVFATFLPAAGGSVSGSMSVGGNLSVSGTLSAAAFSGGLNVPGALTQAGQQVWHAGNFNPASYVPASGGTFSGQVVFPGGIYLNGGNPLTSNGWRSAGRLPQGYALHWLVSGAPNATGFGASGGGFYWFSTTADDASAACNYTMQLDAAGNLVATGNVSAYSDIKFKKNVRTIDGALAIIEQLRGVRYVRKSDDTEHVGVIAQEVEKVLPEVVGTTRDGLCVDYGNIVGPLIEAVKELAVRVRHLEGQ